MVGKSKEVESTDQHASGSIPMYLASKHTSRRLFSYLHHLWSLNELLEEIYFLELDETVKPRRFKTLARTIVSLALIQTQHEG